MREVDYKLKVVVQPQDEEFRSDIKKYIINTHKKRDYLLRDGDSIGAEFAGVVKELEGKVITYQIWLINPNERFKIMRKEYYKGASIGVIIGDDAGKINEIFRELSEYIKRVVMIRKPKNLVNAIHENLETVIKEEILK